MIRIRAHFDGKVIVPDEPVDLPPNTVLDLRIEDGSETETTVPLKGTRLEDLLELAGTWHGDDADEIIRMIFESRSSRQIPLLD